MDLEKALLDPVSVFARPEDVLAETALTREQKVRILRRWEYDARELAVAEEENMGNGVPDQLASVRAALDALGVTPDTEHGAPTKQGGE